MPSTVFDLKKVSKSPGDSGNHVFGGGGGNGHGGAASAIGGSNAFSGFGFGEAAVFDASTTTDAGSEPTKDTPKEKANRCYDLLVKHSTEMQVKVSCTAHT